jgi:hypothetical protein
MTFVKRDFKNIYESGVKELTDIELKAVDKAQEKKIEHSQEQKQTAQQSLEHLEKKSELLQVELKQSINESLKKLQDTLAIENAQSKAFLDSLMAELKTLTEQMKVKLSALKQSHHENVDFAKTVAAEHYLTNTEEMSFAIEHALSNAIQNMGVKAKGNFQNLELYLEQALADVQDNVTEVTKSNLVSMKDKADTVADHSSSLLKTFFDDSQNKLSQLEGSARKANNEVESSSVSLLEDIANHADFTEKEINSTYENITTAHFQNADNRLSKFADELSTLHDTTTEKLIITTDELSDDLLDRSKQVQIGLRNRCDDVVNRLDNLFGSFQSKLNDRLQFSRGQKQALESDKNKILVAVQNEMLSIQRAFGKKIAGMLDQSKGELVELTKSVEAQMLTATESLGEKMSKSANSIQQQIENEVTKFLQEISSVRGAAIDEISIAAKGNISFSPSSDADSTVEDKTDIEDENDLSVEEKDDLTVEEKDLTMEEKYESPQVTESDEETLSSVDSQSQIEYLSSEENKSSEAIENEEESDASGTKPRRSRRRKDNQQ